MLHHVHNHRIIYTSFNTLYCKYANTMITHHFQNLHVSACLDTTKRQDMRILKVAGDHRVGILAKEHIKAGVELFNDYGCAWDLFEL